MTSRRAPVRLGASPFLKGLMGRYEIILGKVPINTEPEKEIVKETPNLSKLRSPGVFNGLHVNPAMYDRRTVPEVYVPQDPRSAYTEPLGFGNPRREPWLPPPMPINETRRLNRFSFLHDPNIAVQIENISHSCFEAIMQASEENNRLLPRLGYHRFRPLVINAAREFFIVGDVFLMWGENNLLILDPNHVQIRRRPNSSELDYFLNSFTTSLGQMDITMRFRQQESRTRIENVFHLSRHISSYETLGNSIIMRNADDPAVCEIPNIGHERYVSQFVDVWVNSNIMSV